MKKRLVNVQFTGQVEVQMPDDVSDENADILASKIALSKILATTENVDAPEDQACEEYLEENNSSESHWDESTAVVVVGDWVDLGITPA